MQARQVVIAGSPALPFVPIPRHSGSPLLRFEDFVVRLIDIALAGPNSEGSRATTLINANIKGMQSWYSCS